MVDDDQEMVQVEVVEQKMEVQGRIRVSSKWVVVCTRATINDGVDDDDDYAI